MLQKINYVDMWRYRMKTSVLEPVLKFSSDAVLLDGCQVLLMLPPSVAATLAEATPARRGAAPLYQ